MWASISVGRQKSLTDSDLVMLLKPGSTKREIRRVLSSARGSYNAGASQRHPLQSSVATDRIDAAKGRVRPGWSPGRWRRDDLRSRTPWPGRRGDVKSLPAQTSSGTTTRVDPTRPARIRHDLARLWPDARAFSLSNLLGEHGDTDFCVGTDDTGEDDDIITLTLSEYLKYAETEADGDDSPLYIFDDRILEEDPLLRKAYAIPPEFPEDYMRVMPERPPYCWLLIGAKRSGTALHVDPTCTAAWNTLVSGRKRWFLFPPESHTNNRDNGDEYRADDSYHEKDGDASVVSDSAVHWLFEQYPNMSKANGGLDFEQLPGETVYVPPGWRHAVVNLALSVAVTRNFVGPHNVKRALASMRQEEGSEAASAWESQLRRRGWLE